MNRTKPDTTPAPLEFPVLLLNSAVLSTTGQYSLRAIDRLEAKALADGQPIFSALGHAAAASIFSRVLDQACAVNRVRIHQEVGQTALVLRPLERPAEGVVLNEAQMNQCGWELLRLERLA